MSAFSPRNLAACLVYTAAGLTTLVPVSFADDASTKVPESDEVIVTGTRDAGRTKFNSLTPIDVISQESIGASASSDMADRLAELVPSFNVQQQPSANGQQFVRPARLRGLSPDETLVLVNGERFHRSSLISVNGAQAPDLAQIAGLAIKRIEVLRDGDSAQYGSDAIAGVINIILDDAPGFETFAQYSSYYHGDGNNPQAGARAGFSLGDGGFAVVTGEWSDSQETSRTRQRPDAIAFQSAHPDLDVPNPVQHWGLPEQRAYKVALNSMLPLTSGLEAYLFGTFDESHGVNDFNWRNPDTTGSSFNPSRVFPGFNLRSIYPTGFAPRFGQDSTDSQINGGLKGSAGDDFRWNVGGSFGRNRISYFMNNTINASLGPDSPTSFKPGALQQKEVNVNADFVYLWRLSALPEPINVAFGAERRDETYGIFAGNLASYEVGPGAATGLAPGSNGFPGFSPAQAGEWDQKSYAGYLDVEVPIIERLTVGGAARYEHFSGFGEKVTGKFATRFELARGLALRGSYSTGFRAPTPGQAESTSISQGLDTVTLQLFTTGRLSPLNPVAQFFGARPLKPEESKTGSLGLTWQTDVGFSGSVDAYNINVSGRFSQSRTFTVTPAIQAQLIAQGVPGAATYTAVNFFTNDFDTRTRGVDVVGSYAQHIGPGRMELMAAFNENQTKVTSGSLAANPAQKATFEKGIPQQNMSASASYAVGPVKVLGRVRYYGSWTDSTGNTTGELLQSFGSINMVDVAVSYDVLAHLTATVGADNVFNSYPDQATFQASRGLIYSRNSPYSTDGGLYYVRLNARF